MSARGFGYIVLTMNYGEWKDDWDGIVHRLRRDGIAALEECTAAGYECVLVRCVPAGASSPIPSGKREL